VVPPRPCVLIRRMSTLVSRKTRGGRGRPIRIAGLPGVFWVDKNFVEAASFERKKRIVLAGVFTYYAIQYMYSLQHGTRMPSSKTTRPYVWGSRWCLTT